MKSIIIDDEAAAVASLDRILKDYCPSVEIIGASPSVEGGLKLIAKTHPDLLFLDVQMPGSSGFDLLDQLPKDQNPEVIFVTSQDNYALAAIQRAALGYLLKPVEPRELIKAVELAKTRIQQKDSEGRMELLLKSLRDPQASNQKISVPSEQGMDFVEVGHITHCEGVDRCTKIHLTDAKPLLSSYSIGEFRKMLETYGFTVVHRSFLVNRHHITHYDRTGTITVTGGERLPVSRRRRQEVLDLLATRVD